MPEEVNSNCPVQIRKPSDDGIKYTHQSNKECHKRINAGVLSIDLQTRLMMTATEEPTTVEPTTVEPTTVEAPAAKTSDESAVKALNRSRNPVGNNRWPRGDPGYRGEYRRCRRESPRHIKIGSDRYPDDYRRCARFRSC